MSIDIVGGPVKHGSPELDELLVRIAEGAEERERELRAPYDIIELVRPSGLLALRVPIEDGGGGASVREFFQVLIALAQADSNVAHILRTHFSWVEQCLQGADPDVRARWLGEVVRGQVFGNAISELSGRQAGMEFETTLTPNSDGTGYALDGTKYYSTGSLYSDWSQVYATLPDGRIAAAIVPITREGVTLEDDWDGFGQTLTGTGTTRLHQVAVNPDEVFVYGSPEDEQPPSYQFAFLQLYLIAVTAGILRSVRQDAVALVRRRKRGFSHAAEQLPADDPQVLQVVGEIASDAFAAEAIVLVAAESIGEAAASLTDGLPDPELSLRAQVAAAEAKVAVDRFSFKTATALFDAGGASATKRSYNLDRHWRNARTVAGHNPTFGKATAVGDFFVNGKPLPLPLNGYF
jgi:alkylation response protein AidB-like acyl-CoA dehydrogenase